MLVNKAYKTELQPTKAQEVLLAKTLGCYRFVYNWSLETRTAAAKDKQYFNCMDQAKALVLVKNEKTWLREVSSVVLQSALLNLDKAWQNCFFKKRSGFPKFKSKKSKQSFTLSSTGYCVTDKAVYFLKIGWIKLKEHDYIPLNAKRYFGAAVSKVAGRWFVAINCEVAIPDPPKAIEVLGIDLGIKNLATCSDGTVIENPKHYDKSLLKLAKAQRQVSRKVKGSNNRLKAIARLQRVHYQIACQRSDYLHKFTSQMARTKPRILVLEDLNVAGMLKNRSLAKVLSGAAFCEIRRQFVYKTSWYGGEVRVVDRFFPSSRLCSSCGTKNETLTLKDRTFVCPTCGFTIDRDLNAAINLKHTVGYTGINACGENIRPIAGSQLEAISLKQEPVLAG